MNFSLSVDVGDQLGLGKAAHSIPDTIEAIGNTGKNLAEAGNIIVNTIKNAIDIPFDFSKKYEENVDRNRNRRIEDIRNANLQLNEEDYKKFKEKTENIKNNYDSLENISENDLFKLRQIDAFKKVNEKNKNGGDIENGGFKNEIINAIDSIKDVEMKQNIFQNSNIHAHFQQINNVLQNHEGRIGVLEGTVSKHGEILSNHENRIGKLENTVSLHSRQLANHERRIGNLEGTVAKHEKILANHEGRIGRLEGTVSQHSR